MSRTRNQNVVLNPNSPPTGKVDPWLHRDDHTGFELAILLWRQTRLFVDLQSKTVPKAVSKVLFVPRFGDHISGGRVHIAHFGAGANFGDRLLLGS